MAHAPGGHPRRSGRHSARSRRCSTSRTWPSSQISYATRCTPPSLPSPCTPKQARPGCPRGGLRGLGGLVQMPISGGDRAALLEALRDAVLRVVRCGR